ncbi:MAG: ketoacyl-ACP synthase III [bacterium]|nr:ketoacyl-ACP synthase III [bacterium]
MTHSAGILGVGAYVPETVCTNQDIVNRGVNTSHDWIVERTGIHARRLASEHETTTYMSEQAARKALASAGLNPQDLDMIVVATTTPDYRGFPSVATQVQVALGAGSCPAWDLSAACSGFVYGLDVVTRLIESGGYQRVLLIAADRLSHRVDWSDRSTCILFGDGAGAVVLGRVDTGGVVATALHADGSHGSILSLPNDPPYIDMDGQSVFKVAVNCVVPSVLEALELAGLTVSDVDWFIPHQANQRIMDHAIKKLGLPADRMVCHIDRYGNTSAASIPIGLAEASAQFKSGDVVVVIGFGAGFTWGTGVILWQ